MLAATETTKDSILSIIITPFQKKAGFGQRKDYSTKLTFRTVFQKMRLCFFGVEDSLDMTALFLCCERRRYIFALRPDVLYFLHAAA